MLLTNNQIYLLYEALLSLKQNNKNDISILTGFSILRNLQILEPIYKLISETRLQILLTAGNVNAEGNIKIPQEKIEEINMELCKLASIENEVNLILLNLSDISSLFLSLDEIEKLCPIINGEA